MSNLKILKNFKDAHDRFMIIDSTEVYHIGAFDILSRLER